METTAQPIFDEYIGKFKIESIEFENLTLGTLPPTIHGKFYEIYSITFLTKMIGELMKKGSIWSLNHVY